MKEICYNIIRILYKLRKEGIVMFNSKYSKVLTVILIIVIIGIVGTIGYFVYDLYVVKSKNNKAQEILEEFSNASIRREFDDTDKNESDSAGNPLDSINGVESNSTANSEKVYMEGYEVMGTIEIPKTNLNLPILAEVTKKSLETSVAILYGVGLNEPGNTTIVGHNYRNGLFFSDNKKLAVGDVIYITDQSGNRVTYEIYDRFQTTPSDAKYMERDTEGAREISLSTCTDNSKARLILLAKEK